MMVGVLTAFAVLLVGFAVARLWWWVGGFFGYLLYHLATGW